MFRQTPCNHHHGNGSCCEEFTMLSRSFSPEARQLASILELEERGARGTVCKSRHDTNSPLTKTFVCAQHMTQSRPITAGVLGSCTAGATSNSGRCDPYLLLEKYQMEMEKLKVAQAHLEAEMQALVAMMSSVAHSQCLTSGSVSETRRGRPRNKSAQRAPARRPHHTPMGFEEIFLFF